MAEVTDGRMVQGGQSEWWGIASWGNCCGSSSSLDILESE